MKSYNVMIDGQNIFDQSVRTNLITYDNIKKNATDHGDDNTTGCFLDNNYYKNYYKMIAIDLSKQQALDADPKAIQQINFTGNLDKLILLEIQVQQCFSLRKKQKKPF